MKQILLLIIVFALAFTSCDNGNTDAEAKKKELQEARAAYDELRDKISKLEKELQELDPEYAKEANKAILVSTLEARQGPFEHHIEVRGSVASRKNVMLSAQVGGTIEIIHVREGQQVAKGQTLVSLDADVIRNSIKELKTSLELATSIYEKQARLWEQKIGTEVQYLEAKNSKESLESRLATAYEQLDQAIIKAPFTGTVDNIPVREGEIASPGLPILRITSPTDMYITADVSERYIGKFKVNDKVSIYLPVQDVTIESSISAVGQVINPDNRTFSVEIRLPSTKAVLKPNQVAVITLRDYFALAAFVVPTRLIQTDNKGKYVYKVEQKGEKQVAAKLYVTPGLTYDGHTEVLEGLVEGLQIIDKGFRDLTQDAEIAIATSEEATSEVARN